MYEAYWELSEPPFDNSPNPKFFYLSPEHEEALVRLVYTVTPEGLRDADGRVRLREDHSLARPHPAPRGRALRDRPPDQPRVDSRRLPPRGALPDGRRD